MSAVLAEVATKLTARKPSNRKSWRTKPHPTLERVAGVVAMLIKRPYTARALYEALGIANSSNGIQTLLDILHEKGLLFIRGWERSQGRSVAIYQWKVGTIGVDAPKPVSKRGSRAKRPIAMKEAA
jgi:hypothetical protein